MGQKICCCFNSFERNKKYEFDDDSSFQRSSLLDNAHKFYEITSIIKPGSNINYWERVWESEPMPKKPKSLLFSFSIKQTGNFKSTSKIKILTTTHKLDYQPRVSQSGCLDFSTIEAEQAYKCDDNNWHQIKCKFEDNNDLIRKSNKGQLQEIWMLVGTGTENYFHFKDCYLELFF